MTSNSLSQISLEVTRKKKELKTINESVLERKRYLKEQEDTVEVAISNFNNKLRELQSDITIVDREKDTGLRELADLQIQVRETKSEISDLNNKLETIKKLYDDSMAKFKIELREIKTEITQAQMNRTQAINQASKVIRDLSYKEKELNIREKILDERDKN